MSEKNDEGFKVIDRRRFDTEGNPTAEASPPPEAPPPQEEPAPSEHRGPGFTARPAPGGSPLPEMSFSTFVLSLHASAIVHLGLVEDPGAKERPQPQFELAKQSIEILSMLEEKTRGNLTPEELQLLQGVLYELRLQYVEQSRPQQGSG